MLITRTSKSCSISSQVYPPPYLTRFNRMSFSVRNTPDAVDLGVVLNVISGVFVAECCAVASSALLIYDACAYLLALIHRAIPDVTRMIAITMDKKVSLPLTVCAVC